MVEATIEDFAIPTVSRGYLTKSNGGAVLSTTLPRDLRCGQALEQWLKWLSLELTSAVHRR